MYKRSVTHIGGKSYIRMPIHNELASTVIIEQFEDKMSIAGIRSNRGDGYQTLIALEWALTVLSDPEFRWIEVDSAKYLVDD